MKKITRQSYSDMYGPTTGDKIRLADTELFIEVEKDLTTYGEEVNEFLEFDRLKSRGKRLNIPSGTAVRFEPGQSRDVELIDFLGGRNIYGFNKKIMGSLK